jgi:hypothetical protein
MKKFELTFDKKNSKKKISQESQKEERIIRSAMKPFGRSDQGWREDEG